MRAGMGEAGQADHREGLAHFAEPLGLQHRLAQLGREPHRFHEPAPRGVDLCFGTVGVDPAHDLGRLHEGVVGEQRRRAVAGGAPHPKRRPVRALLADDDRELDPRRRGDGDAARLGDDVVGGHGVGLVLDQPLGPGLAEVLLVGHGEEHEVAGGPEAVLGQVAGGDRHGRGEVEHVYGAPTPYLAVDELAAERVSLPPIGVGRHHVGVAHQHHAGRVGISPPDAADQARPTGYRLVALEVDARPLEIGRQQVGVARLLARVRGTVVDARVPNQVLEEVCDFAGDVVHRRRAYAYHRDSQTENA